MFEAVISVNSYDETFERVLESGVKAVYGIKDGDTVFLHSYVFEGMTKKQVKEWLKGREYLVLNER